MENTKLKTGQSKKFLTKIERHKILERLNMLDKIERLIKENKELKNQVQELEKLNDQHVKTIIKSSNYIINK
tara:strand:+ start:203 stop:418 length:216 start_codon:yes stop_codon:yes gene_type:complete